MGAEAFRRLSSAVAAIVLLSASPAAAADESLARFAIDIQGFVPIICNASVDANVVPIAPGEANLGQLKEFCNNSAGYQVYADYSADLAEAVLVVDGKEVSLSDAGSTLVSSSQTAAVASHDLALRLPEGVTGGAISFRIVAA